MVFSGSYRRYKGLIAVKTALAVAFQITSFVLFWRTRARNSETAVVSAIWDKTMVEIHKSEKLLKIMLCGGLWKFLDDLEILFKCQGSPCDVPESPHQGHSNTGLMTMQ